MPRLKMRPRRRQRFCELIAEGWSVSAACRVVGIHRSAAYRLRDAHPEFRSAWAEAWESGADMLEDTARELAIEGSLVPVYWQGKVVGHQRRRSEMLLMLLLRGRRPEVFRDHAGIAADDGQRRAFADAVRESAPRRRRVRSAGSRRSCAARAGDGQPPASLASHVECPCWASSPSRIVQLCLGKSNTPLILSSGGIRLRRGNRKA